MTVTRRVQKETTLQPFPIRYYQFSQLLCQLLFVTIILCLPSKALLSAPEQSKATANQRPTKTSPIEIHILTIDRGEGLDILWSWWGHTAVWVRDNEKDLDLVFDYGIFAGVGPQFLYNYLFKGLPAFFLGVDYLASNLARNKAQGRRVRAQKLIGNTDQLRQLYHKLLVNARPENRAYHYHHFYNNCTTKIRDLLDEFFGQALSNKYRKLSATKNLRELGSAPTIDYPPVWLIAHIMSGYTLNQNHYNQWQTMFIPENLLQALAELEKYDNEPKVGPIHTLWQDPARKQQIANFPSITKIVSAWILFVCVISLWIFILYIYPLYFPNKPLAHLSRVLGWWLCYLPLGILGLVFTHIYFHQGSASFGYQTVGYNFSLHGLHPLNLILCLAWFFLRKKKHQAMNQQKQLWFWLHRSLLLIAELGAVLALLFANFAVLPSLGIIILMQRLIVMQIKRGYL